MLSRKRSLVPASRLAACLDRSPPSAAPKAAPGALGHLASGTVGREVGKQVSDTMGHRGTWVLCPHQAPSHVLSVKPWKLSPRERPSQAGDRHSTLPGFL